MRKLCLLLALTLPLAAQHNKPFSQHWEFNTTRPWLPEANALPGVIVGALAYIYAHETDSENPVLKAAAITFLISLGYEFYRWGEGKIPLFRNPVYAAAASLPFNVTLRYTWGKGHSSWKVGP